MLKCKKNRFPLGSAPDPAGGAYSAPSYPIAVFKGATSKGRAEKKEGGKKREREVSGGASPPPKYFGPEPPVSVP